MSEKIENVVVISADSLREKDLKLSEEAFPFLQEEMERPGDYYSNASWTVPAHASIFSGKLVSEHGTNTQNMYFDSENKLEKYFNSKDFDTVLISENNLLTTGLGFSSDFDEAVEITRKKGKLWNEDSWRVEDRFSGRWSKFFWRTISTGDLESISSFSKTVLEKFDLKEYGEKYNPTYSNHTIEEILESVNGSGKKFVFSNLMPTHTDYTFKEEDKEEFLSDVDADKIREVTSVTDLHEVIEEKGELSKEDIDILENSYKASIRYLDRILRELYEKLPRNTLLLVIGDHGEVIGEHPFRDELFVEHHFGTFEELVEVPFRYKFKGDQSLNLDFEASDHSRFLNIIKTVFRDEGMEDGFPIFCEYYGKSSIASFFGESYPDEFSELYERESFSVISGEFKLDMASDGTKLWELGEYESEEVDNPEKIEEMNSKIPFVLRTILEEKNLF